MEFNLPSVFPRFLNSEENARVLVEWLRLKIVKLGLQAFNIDVVNNKEHPREIQSDMAVANKLQDLTNCNKGAMVDLIEASSVPRILLEESLDNSVAAPTPTALCSTNFKQLKSTVVEIETDSPNDNGPEAIPVHADSSANHTIYGDDMCSRIPSDAGIEIGNLTLEEALDECGVIYEETNSPLVIVEEGDQVANKPDRFKHQPSKELNCEHMDVDNESPDADNSRSPFPGGRISLTQPDSEVVTGSVLPSNASSKLAQVLFENTTEDTPIHGECIRENPLGRGSVITSEQQASLSDSSPTPNEGQTSIIAFSGTFRLQETANAPCIIAVDQDDSEPEGDHLDSDTNRVNENDLSVNGEPEDCAVQPDDDGGISPSNNAVESTTDLHLIPSVTSWDIMTVDTMREEPVAKRRGPSMHPIRQNFISVFVSWTGIQEQYEMLKHCNASFRVSSSIVDGINRNTGVEQSHSSLGDLHNQFRDIADISSLISGEHLNCVTNSSLTQLSTICQLMRTCSIQLPAVQRHAHLNVRFYRTHITQVYLQLYRWLFDFGPDLAERLWESCKNGWTLGVEYDTLYKIVISIYEFVRKSSRFEGKTLSIYAGEVAPLALDGRGYQIDLQVEYPKLSRRQIFTELFMQAIYVIVLRPNLPEDKRVGDVQKQQDGLAVITYVCNVFYSCFGSLAFALLDEWEEVLKNPIVNLYEKVNSHRPALNRLVHSLRIGGASGMKSLVEALSNGMTMLSSDSLQLVCYYLYSDYFLGETI